MLVGDLLVLGLRTGLAFSKYRGIAVARIRDTSGSNKHLRSDIDDPRNLATLERWSRLETFSVSNQIQGFELYTYIT